jgi:hypothetical protein
LNVIVAEAWEGMAVTPSDGDDNQPIFAGCLLMLLSLAVIVAVGLTLVRWRDPNSGATLPRDAPIQIPVVAGALFYAIVAGLLRMLGVRVLPKPMKESCHRPNDFERSERDKRTRGEPDAAADRPRD